MNTIQNKINDAFVTVFLHHDDLHNETSKPHAAASTNAVLQCEHHFDTLFLTVVLFLEQDPFTNIAIYLDVNFCKVKQKNYKKKTDGKTMQDEIWMEGGDTFQNSPIHLLFYERITSTEFKAMN